MSGHNTVQTNSHKAGTLPFKVTVRRVKNGKPYLDDVVYTNTLERAKEAQATLNKRYADVIVYVYDEMLEKWLIVR